MGETCGALARKWPERRAIRFGAGHQRRDVEVLEYQLRRPAAKTSSVQSRPEVQSKELPFVEVRAAVTTPSAAHFELELRGGRCLRIPAAFEDAPLKRLVRVLEELT